MKPFPISSNDESKIQITLDYHYQLSQQVILSKILTKKFHGSKIRNSPRILFLFVSHPRFSCYNDLKKKKKKITGQLRGQKKAVSQSWTTRRFKYLRCGAVILRSIVG